MTILIENRQNRFRISTGQIREVAQTLLNALGSPEGELSVLLTDDADIADLNKQYLDREGATNVIAFPMAEGEFAEISPDLLGDVVISMDTAAREAEMGETTIENRFKELLIHGILHLFGYDHETNEADAQQMENKSEELLEAVRSVELSIR
ncbi:MAG: rRNA maturation RNase YbeY [Desulfobacterales bacterium]|nr:rRNA maturation RNase YbeY [Desulfobacterales bacterium]